MSTTPTIEDLEPGQFLLVVPDVGIHEIYERYEAAANEATSFVNAGVAARVWNYQGRLVYGRAV